MWDYHSLYTKAQAFARKGLEHQEPSSTEVPFWCIVSLELLARATLSHENPALLADLRSEDSLLAICGIATKKTPVSAPANLVFKRCMDICERFSDEDYRRCLVWLNLRNEELHTGKLPFENLKTSMWRPDFYRICSVLLDQSNSNLEEFIGAKQAATAETMIESLSEKRKKEAEKSVSCSKKKFENLDVDERADSLKNGSKKAKSLSTTYDRYIAVKCPSCGGKAVLAGDLIRSTTPIDSDGELVQEDVWLPVGLECYCCDLKLVGHALVSAVGLGDQFVTVDSLDPAEYYEIIFDPRDYYDRW